MIMFEPKIAGFLCNWCAYAGADLAGVSRVQYPPNLRVIHVMCSGRVDPIFVLKAFGIGIDGVIVLGCHPGDCHYQTGNYQAEHKMRMTQFVLETIGINLDRLRFDYVSAAEGRRFGEVIFDFTKKVREIGPINEVKDLDEKTRIGKEIVRNTRIRWLIGKEWELIEQGNVFGKILAENDFKDLMTKSIVDQYKKELICSMIEDKPLPVKEIAQRTKLCPSEVFRYLTYMENIGLVSLMGHKNNSPQYQKVHEK